LQQTVIWPFCGLLQRSKRDFGHFVVCCIAANSILVIFLFAATKQREILFGSAATQQGLDLFWK
ncbi:MAG: hypothetical protein LBV41_10930, partial [Cytophagaceae bacterium]|nr:hypothetical protein [Cytophagaceae bacterium]